MKNINNITKTEKNFDILRNYYPKVLELFARELFYRNNQLPNEVNDIIEIYCLSLSDLNGKLCSTNKYLRVIKSWESSEKIKARVLQLIPGSPLQIEEEMKRKLQEEAFDKTISRFWKIDIKNFYNYKKKAFNSLIIKLEKNETIQSEVFEIVEEISKITI